MIIDRPTFFVDPHGFSLLQFEHRQKEYTPTSDLRISLYSFSKPSFYIEFEMHLKDCKERECTLHLDGSTELLSYEVFQYLLSREGNLDRLTLYTNGPDRSGVEVGNLRKLGARVIEEPFFLKYHNYYRPSSSLEKLKTKKFSLLTGTPRFERSILIGLLQNYGLIEHGHVSYFGVDQYQVVSEHLKQLDKDATCPDDLKKMCRQGLETLDKDLIIDASTFDHNVGTARIYNSEPFQKSEINIAIESHFWSDVTFFTEKIVKPVQQGNRIILGWTPNKLTTVCKAVANYMGKDIYDLVYWGDTSYDLESNLYLRLDLICKKLIKEI